MQLVYPVAAEIMDLPTTIAGRIDDKDRTIGFRERWYRRYTKHKYRFTVSQQRRRAEKLVSA